MFISVITKPMGDKMKKAQLNILGFALVFVVTFLIGGIIGVASLPEFPGRFFISGLVFGAFATGAGSIIFKYVAHHR